MESFVSDIPVGYGKTANLFLQCTETGRNPYSIYLLPSLYNSSKYNYVNIKKINKNTLNCATFRALFSYLMVVMQEHKNTRRTQTAEPPFGHSWHFSSCLVNYFRRTSSRPTWSSRCGATAQQRATSS
jgi:hypothetical protein